MLNSGCHFSSVSLVPTRRDKRAGKAWTSGPGREWLTLASLPLPIQPAPHSITIWEAILSSLALRRELNRASPETYKSKGGRTSRKLPSGTESWAFDPYGQADPSSLQISCAPCRTPRTWTLKALQGVKGGEESHPERALGPERQGARRKEGGRPPCSNEPTPGVSQDAISTVGSNHLAITPFRTQSAGRSLRS